MKRLRKPRLIPAMARFAPLVAAWIVFVLAANGVFLYTSWRREGVVMESEAVAWAESLQSLIHPEHVAALAGDAGDLERVRYARVKSALTRLVQADDDIFYACIIAIRNGRFRYLADSINPADPSSAIPGALYPGATEAYYAALAEGKSLMISNVMDPGGAWARALVPIRDADSGTPMALFALSFDGGAWRRRLLTRMYPDFAVSLSLTILSAALLALYAAHTRLRERSAQTAANEALLRELFHQAPIGVAIASRTHLLSRAFSNGQSMNQSFLRHLGQSPEALSALKWADIPLDGIARARLSRFFAKDLPIFTAEGNFLRPDEQDAYLTLKATHLEGSAFGDAYLVIVEDSTERHAAEEALREAERSKAVLLSHLPGMAYRCRYDSHWTMESVSDACLALTGYEPHELIENRVVSYAQLIAPEYAGSIRALWREATDRAKGFRSEYEIIKKSGERRWVYEIAQIVPGPDGEVSALEGIIVDITDRKEHEREIAYMSEHDQLTGLYDRRYIIEAAARLDAAGRVPVSVAVCDINSMRMVNFAFGNEEGDRLIAAAGRIIAGCARPGDLIGRTGGDEFTLLLLDADSEEAARIVRGIQAAVDRYNRADGRRLYEVGLSIGFETKTSANVSMEQVIKAAGTNLMHAKLLNQKSAHSALLSSIMATLYARNQETEAHGHRLSRYARMVGKALGLQPREMDELQLLSMLHDIGKIGIGDHVLNKPGPLTPKEREAMQEHCKIGHRIALSSPELSHIADYVLSHHEKWDGSGYPAGLAGEEIPLLARILAVCDAYDAMTEDRVYRRALSQEEALTEIERCAGAQFDPTIAYLFIELMRARR
jgi:diguanylate cyclase (GGDEF)-like protein/PAS domain S-box-containing protein